ncbi:MAG: hypothetical protein Q7N95_08375 [Alphaproteobacteria bacterium]|nr:hypothetical protein [Alphaproteobacteria bacterium]
MKDPSKSSGNPTEDVLSTIQEVIDAPRLPFPARNVPRAAEPEGIEARVAKLEAGIDYVHRSIVEIKTELQIMRGNARSDFRLIFAALIAVALGLAGLLAKGFRWL